MDLWTITLTVLLIIGIEGRPHENGTATGQWKVIYIDWEGINWNAPQDTVTQAVDAGFNVINLAFWLNSGPADMAQAWSTLSDSTKTSTINYAHSKGAKVLVSAGGSTDAPYAVSSGSDYGNRAAKFAQQNHLDGVDFDMENFQSPMTYPPLNANQTIQWLVDCSNAARSVLGSAALITHAPQAPYFGRVGGGSGTNPWTGTTGGYTAVYQRCTTINFFNAQFYNQGSSCYVSYNDLFVSSSSCSPFPGTALEQIASYGVPQSKLVVGKPITSSEASNGYVSASNLGSWFTQAQNTYGWTAGVMGWEWTSSGTDSTWIKTIYP